MSSNSTTDDGQRTTTKQDWRLYAAAGAAALAAGSTADAAIIYVDPTLKTTATLNTGGKHFSIDGLNVNLLVSNGSAFEAGAFLNGGRNFFFDESGGTGAGYAMKFKPGSSVKGVPAQDVAFRGIKTFASNTVFGAFTTGKTGIGGFKLPSSKGGGEGWLRVEVSSINGDSRPDELTVIDWAYNDAGGGISAGQETAVPEPSALGLLAMGSAGLLAWRRRAAGPTNG